MSVYQNLLEGLLIHRVMEWTSAFLLSRLRMGLENFISNKFSGDADVADPHLQDRGYVL